MKCPSLEEIYDMDLENLLSLKSNIQQNKINFNMIPLDEDDYDLYDYNSQNKESIIELVNSEIKERESTKELLNFFTNLNFENNANSIETKFLQELNNNNINNKINNILEKNKIEEKIITKNVDNLKNINNNEFINNKNILNKNQNNNQPIKLIANEGIKSLLKRTKIDPTQFQYTVSSNKYVDKFWSFDKEKKLKKKFQNTHRDSDISNSNTNSNTNSIVNGTYNSHNSHKYFSSNNIIKNNIKSERKNWVVSEKIIIGAIPISKSKKKKKKKKRKKKNNEEDESKKMSCLELMRNYKVSDVTQFLKKKTNLKPLNASSANNKNHNYNINPNDKNNNNEFSPNIKLYNKTQSNNSKIKENTENNNIIQDNQKEKNDENDKNKLNKENNNICVDIRKNNIQNNSTSGEKCINVESTITYGIEQFYFEYQNNIMKEIKYEKNKYKELNNQFNNFYKKNNENLKKKVFEITKYESLNFNKENETFSEQNIKNVNKYINQYKNNYNYNYENYKNNKNDGKNHLQENLNEKNEINLGPLYDEKLINSNNISNKKYNENKNRNENQEKISINLDKNIDNQIINKKIDKEKNYEENDINNNRNKKELNINDNNKEISSYQKSNNDEEKKENININSNNNLVEISLNKENNQNEDKNKEEENEEYEEEEDEINEIVENNKEKIYKNRDIIQELISNKNSNFFFPKDSRNMHRKHTLNPIYPKNKNINKNMNSFKSKLNYKSENNNMNNNHILNKHNIINDNCNSSERFEQKNDSQNQIQNKKYVLSSVKPHSNISHYNFSKNLLKPPTQRPRTSISKNILMDNSNVDLEKIVDYSNIYSNFSELFSGYFLSNNYSQQGSFNLHNTIGELYESFNKLYYYELNKGLIDQKDEMYNDIVRAEAGVIINRIKHAQEKLLKEDDINTNIEKYCILKKCLELEKKNYAREDYNNNCEIDNPIYKYKKFFRVVLSRPEIYDIVCYTLYKDNSWSELPHGLSLGQCWNLYWSYGPPNIEFSKLFSFQKVNHLINNRIVHRKDLLHKHIMRVRKLNKKCNEIFDIMPLTFLLSKEYVNFVEEFQRIKDTDDYNIWIVKPVGKSRGKGIFLINNISDVPLNDTFLVQKYLSNPLLLDDGYKFDMRIYCLVTSVNPLEMFLYKDGFARVSNELYSMDISNIKVHLTNAAIQNRQAKKSKNYEKIYGGSKISLDMLRYKLRNQYGIDFDTAIWPQVKDIITKAFICCQNDIPYCPSTFEMFGFDVIIDSNLKCWLLEINSSPSLERSNVLDDEIKLPLVKDIIKIVHPAEVDKIALINVLERLMKIKNNPRNKNVYLYSPKIQLNIDLTNIFYGKIPRKYGEEPEDMGRFEMICPNKETDKLIKMAGGQKYYNNKKEKN